MNPIQDDILMHYGVKRRSGRYPWGSGDNPFQHGGDFLSRVEDLQSQGKSEKEIADELKMSTIIELRKSISDTATDKEVKDMLDSTFGAGSSLPVDPGAECPDNTATDQEVEDVLNDVFGK